MSASTILGQFHQRGINLFLDGDSLGFDAPAGAVGESDIVLLREFKTGLVALLRQQGAINPESVILNPDAIPDDLLRRVRESWSQFHRVHGRRLAALGWDRQSLLGGTDPLAAVTIDDLDGLPCLLANGAELAFADSTRIDLQRIDSSLITRSRFGIWYEEGPERDAFIQGGAA